ncbi:hotdog family protein, partial [Motilibacter deserti]
MLQIEAVRQAAYAVSDSSEPLAGLELKFTQFAELGVPTTVRVGAPAPGAPAPGPEALEVQIVQPEGNVAEGRVWLA